MNIDCFTYFNESDILRIRLEELDPYVDRFVLVEATETFTGKKKPLYYDELPDWIDRWTDRIVRVVVEFPDTLTTPWEREAYQRNQIMQGLVNANMSDTIIISDVDEIPRPNMFRYLGPVHLDVIQYFWSFNWQVPQHCNQGARPVVSRLKYITTPHEMRVRSDLKRIPYAGWHFSFFGEASLLKTKIESFSHTEMDKSKFKSADHMLECFEEGIDPFDRFPLKWSEIDETYPKFVQEHWS